MTPVGHRPPRLAHWLLGRLLASHAREALLGDLAESRAPRAAYWREVLHAPRTWFAPRPFVTTTPNAGEGRVPQFLMDVRYAWRGMTRRKGMTAVAVGTLALGIGASAAIFSVVHPILLRTVPYPAGDRITMLWERDAAGERSNVGFLTFDDIAREARSFDAVAAMRYMNVTMTTSGEPRPLAGQRVSPDFFRVLGVAPVLGRAFEAADDVRGTPNVLILSDATWRDAFGADPAILERQVVLDGVSYSVVGVLPAEFENVLVPTAQIYAPLRYDASLPWACRTCRHLRVIARLRPGVTGETSTAELDLLAQNLRRDHPSEYATGGMFSESLSRYVTRDVRPALLALLGGVLIVLLVASLNVSNILLARGASRRGEFAVRMALGAGRGRLMRQLLTESALLAVIGGSLGVLLAIAGVRALVAIAPTELPRLSAIGVNGSVLLFALLLTALVGVLFGLVPARRAAGPQLQESLRSGARQLVGSDRVTRSVVVIAEVALALVLLVGSGLLLRSMDRLLAVDPGFDAEGVLTMQVQAGAGALRTDTLVQRFYASALEAVRQLPGVEGASFTSQLPLSGDYDGYGVHLQSRPSANPSDDPSAFRYAVSPGYLETMGIPLVRGRTFTPRDDERAVPVAIVSATFASRHLQGLDPIGQRVRVGAHDEGPWREIVGIVGDVHQESLEAEAPGAIYLPESQWEFVDSQRSLVVRGDGEVSALAPSLRAAIWAVDKDQPIVRVVTAERLVAATAAGRRFALVLFEGFAIVALLLAAAGIYGVLLGSVTERTRELGVRAAFGASASDLVWMVIRQGMTLTLAGVAAGLALALGLTRTITGLLFGISAIDPFTYAAVTVCLLLVALLACFVPAFRAARVDPMETLRAE